MKLCSRTWRILTAVFCVLIIVGLALVASRPAKSMAKQEVPALLQKAEAQRGQPLTPEQRLEFSQTIALLREALQPAQQNFARSVARVFNLPPSKVQAMLPAIGTNDGSFDKGLIPEIEASMGRTITAQELQRLRASDNAKQAEMNEILSRYVEDLGRIAGLSKEQIRRIFPSIGF